MLELNLQKLEFYDERRNVFINKDYGVVRLEHSLLSISKWESKWCVPFLSDDPKTHDQELSYIECMIIGKTSPDLVSVIWGEHLQTVTEYMNSPMSATVISRRVPRGPSPRKQIITTELIYWWMVNFNIPISCEQWHINRLLKLIEICQIKNDPNDKMSVAETAKYKQDLNKRRKEQLRKRG